MRAVVVASGALDAADAAHLDGAGLTIAADGGAASLEGLGRRPQLLIGDLDSVDGSLVERLERGGTRVERHPVDKEASDTELAIDAAFDAGATSVTLIGAAGGDRLDHELANMLLLADPRFTSRDLRAVQGSTVVRALHGRARARLDGHPGDLVTLLPLAGDARGVTTDGLRWPLDGATLRMGRSRGLSNEVVRGGGSVGIEHGTLLIIEISKEATAP
jgi:thiamine pyrophosphokinase